MNEQAERIRKFLKDEYGISTDEELLEAVKNDKGVSIGVFVCQRKEAHGDKKMA